jgi:hypothetical protein
MVEWLGAGARVRTAARSSRRRPVSIAGALVVLVASLLVSTSGPAAGIDTSRYQSDVVRPADLATSARGPVTEVSLDVQVSTRGCADSDTCVGGSRATGGFTWYVALMVELGDSAEPGENEYQFHGGLAVGGIGERNRWYADWSGWYGPDHDTGSGVYPVSKQRFMNFEEDTWYRYRVRRTTNSRCGDSHGWRFTITNLASGQRSTIGVLCADADTISGTYYFTEIIEDDPCTTDFGWAKFRGLSFKDSDERRKGFLWEVADYTDTTCRNSRLRWLGRKGGDRNVVIDVRNAVIPRTHFDDHLLWFALD